MRILNRAHVPWFIFVSLATIASCLLYISTFDPQRLSFGERFAHLSGDTPGYVNVGGTPLGLIFGSISFAIFIFAGLLGLRKKVAVWPVGTVQGWLRAHIWLTLLTIPLVILHTGFRLGGPMTILLVVLYGVVMVSGIYGLVLQHHLPRLMKERFSNEIVYEQIPFIRAQLCAAAEKMRDALAPPSPATLHSYPAATGNTKRTRSANLTISSDVLGPAADTSIAITDATSEVALADFLDRQVLPYLRTRRGKRSGLRNNRYSEDVFRVLKLRVASQYRGEVEEIEAWCDERRMLDLQTRFQHWLHSWLFVHVPLSYLLILMTAWHAFVTLFRY
jgi:hypothetical protein